jgi:uncharacterized protein involved in oxidation of intracellular sulfur
MRTLIILNDAPYGSEKPYNALRLALTLQQEGADSKVRIFLLSDSVTCALVGQAPPEGFYNLGQLVGKFLGEGGEVKACTNCADARGITKLPLIEGVELSTMGQLARWVAESDRVLTF